MSRTKRQEPLLDAELSDLPPELRWREWMGRVEALIFAAAGPVTRETLAVLVGRDCSIDLLIDDIRDELRDRPYDLVSVAGGWQHRTRPRFAAAIRSFTGVGPMGRSLSQGDLLVLSIIAYHQPITRSEISAMTGKEISRDTIAHLRSMELVASGPRSPQPGAPYTLVTTKTFLSQFGLQSLRDLPDREALEDAGLLRKEQLLAGDIPIAAGEEPDDDERGLEFDPQSDVPD
ncbi:SMC-Scp complex subunit ScpB (plasmid) [Rhizobium sp. NIBRBAC000502774]|nr:SMC-Scp complex subunit ScpB [Rhizobium sp. NIBRBAC000502774]